MQAAYSKSATLMHKFVSVTCFLWPAEESSSELSKDARLVAFQKDIWSCGHKFSTFIRKGIPVQGQE